MRTPTHSTVVSYLALFVALTTGAAYAGSKIGPKDIDKNAVRSKHIKKEHVKASDIGAAQVKAEKLAPDSVASSNVIDGTLSGLDIADGSITGTHILDDSLTGDDLGPDSLTGGDIAESTLGKVPAAATADAAAGLSKVTVQTEIRADLAAGGVGSVDAFCPPGAQAVAGGGRGDFGADAVILASRPAETPAEPLAPSDGESFTGWRVTVRNDEPADGVNPEVWVVCVG